MMRERRQRQQLYIRYIQQEGTYTFSTKCCHDVLACPQAQVQLLHFVALSTRCEYFCSAEWGNLERALRLCKVNGFLPAIANSVQHLGLQAEEFCKRKTESPAYLILSDAYLEVVATSRRIEQLGEALLAAGLAALLALEILCDLRFRTAEEENKKHRW